MARTAEPLSPKLSRLLREASWLLLAAVGCYLALILLTYHRSDPGWSHTGGEVVRNTGGPFGAWLADLLLSVFGVSAWWWAAVMALTARKPWR